MTDTAIVHSYGNRQWVDSTSHRTINNGSIVVAGFGMFAGC